MLNQNLLLAGDDAYNLTKSLRFRSSASAYMTWLPTAAGNRKTWTLSFWMKAGDLATDNQTIFSTSQNYDRVGFQTGTNSRELVIVLGSSSANIATSQVFRDPSAWYHIVIAVDTTQATSSNRIKIYVNGSQVTSFVSTTYPSLNYDTGFGTSAYTQAIGRRQSTSNLYFDGYLTEVNFIDGQALTPSSFGSTNALTGVWQPAKYTGTYGTNGFYLPFTDVATTSGSNAGLGKDFSGNGNYWNTNNISVTAGSTYDSMTDVPTLTSATQANYCVMNPLELLSGMALSQGNLYCAAASDTSVKATFALPFSGKYYWEVKDVSQGSRGFLGLYKTNQPLTAGLIATGPNDISYGMWDGKIYAQSGTPSGTYSTSTTNDIVMFAVDAGNNTLYVGKNGTWFNSGVPASGTGYVASLTSGQQYSPWFGDTGGTTTTVAFNFGQQGFTYTPPTGFVALNTFNLPEPSIKQGNKYMDVSLYTGTGATQTITTNAQLANGAMTWTKTRSNAVNWDTRSTGLTNNYSFLQSNTTNAEETTATQYAMTFANGSYTVGAGDNINQVSRTFVGYQWAAGTATSNTAGSISSTVQANPTAGFSVITYTGTGSNATVGHGLGVAPVMIITKRRDSSDQGEWQVSHQSLSGGITGNGLFLNTTSAQFATGGWLASVSSSTIGLTTATSNNGSGRTYVAYCFAEVAGYSKFGSYTGNGSATDGTYIHLGFKPKFIMFKRSDSTSNWMLFDGARDLSNITDSYLYPNLSQTEGTSSSLGVDFLSNGVKIRADYSDCNASGGTYVFAAFAETPFKYSLAR